jgi:glycerol-3-phosphate acyltransferase PlsX
MNQNSKRVRIAIDAMGGDFAPSEIIKGAVQAARELDVDLILTGPKADLERKLEQNEGTKLSISIVDAPDRIIDGEQPAMAVFRKPNSSIVVAFKMVKQGNADAVVSAGSTGAVMASALQYLGTLPGIDRPIAGGPFLGLAPHTIVLDLGASVGCQPYHLVNFAVAGTVYARSFYGIENPTVGLLNVGAEEGKGNDQAKEAYKLLQRSGLNFIGNVEGMDIVRGKANVIVCDGFVGNIVIKFCEGLGRAISGWLQQELAGKAAPEVIKETTAKLEKIISPGVVLGGGPLWGVNGVASKAHGSSKAPHIVWTIKQTKQAVENNFIPLLRAELEKTQKTISN